MLDSSAKPKRAARSAAANEPMHGRIYDALKARLITGGFAPGVAVTLRGLAQELGVSPMPVRAAVTRLAAERALDMRATRRVSVPSMTAERFAELMRARVLLEPEAAARALPLIDEAGLAAIRRHDLDLEAALEHGDVVGYMANNHAFHFAIYRAAPSSVILPLVEALWMQFGPFMRVVYGRLGTATLIDRHHQAIAAIAARDEPGLREAIAADITDGMTLIGSSIFESEDNAPKPKKRR